MLVRVGHRQLGHCVVLPGCPADYDKSSACSTVSSTAPPTRDRRSDDQELSFSELRSLATSANAMVAKRRQDEEALRRSEGTLRSVVQAAPIGIGLVKNRLVDWTNEQLARMTGYSREELTGMSAQTLYESREEFARVEQDKNDQVREHGTGFVETRWRRRDESAFDLLLSSAPIDPARP